MNGRISKVLEKILQDKEASKKLRRILTKDSSSNIIELDGTKYTVDNHERRIEKARPCEKNSKL